MKTSQWGKSLLAGILLLVLSTGLYAVTRQDIGCALASARKDLRISIAMEKRITSELSKLKESGDGSPDIIEDYEFYLGRVKAMVAENRKVVAEMEELSARYDLSADRQDTRKASDGSTGTDETAATVDPLIPEEPVVDEVAVLDRQLDKSLAEFDEMLLKELDLILAKSSERKRDLADEAEAALQRLRDKGIDIDGLEKEATESVQDSTEEQERAEAGKDSSEAGEGPSETGEYSSETGYGSSESGEEMKAEEGRDEAGFKGRKKSRGGVNEASGGHPRNRYDPKDDDIVARQLREAAEGETDPELRKKLWKEYEQYKKNQSR